MSQYTVTKAVKEKYTQIKKLNFTDEIKNNEFWKQGFKSLYCHTCSITVKTMAIIFVGKRTE